MGLGKRFMNFAPRPRRRNRLDSLTADNDRGDLAKLYGAFHTPTWQEIGGYWKANVLAEEAKAIWRKALDLPAQIRGRAELRHMEIRLRCRADRTLRGMDQKESTFDKVRYASAWSIQLPEDVK